MAKLVPDIDYRDRLVRLRDSYVTANPRQRLAVVRERLDDHHFGPNRLVTSVSAVEAYARSLALRLKANSRAELRKLYPKYRNSAPTTLIATYLKSRGVVDLRAFFEEDNWELFRHAVEYRNLLVHECTYLGLDVFPSLIEACERVLEKLEHASDLRAVRT